MIFGRAQIIIKSYVRKFLGFVNRPYPFSFLPSRRIKQILPIGIGVFLFMVVFKPFGLENNPDYILFSAYMVAFGVFAGSITTVLIPLGFPQFFDKTRWSIKRNIIWVFCINIIFAIIMFLAVNLFLKLRYNASYDFGFKNLSWWVLLQIVFGVPLGIIINLVNQFYLLKNHLKIGASVNNIIEKDKPRQIQISQERDKGIKSHPRWYFDKDVNEDNLIDEKDLEKDQHVTPRVVPVNHTIDEYHTQLLEKHMLDSKPHLSERITIAQLSEQIRIPQRQLSNIINSRYGMNFFDFINSYRIKEFNKRIEMGYNHNLTILAIAFDCGFSSKSAFNRAYKKHIGVPPSEFAQSGTC